MIKREIQGKTVKDYTPNARLVEHMQRTLHNVKKLQQIDTAGKDVPKAVEKEKAALSAARTRILDDVVFQAMADITFFFSAVGAHPEIQKLFDDNIKEILGVKRIDPKETPYGFMFAALVSGMLIYRFKTGKDFRLRLNNYLQRMVWNKMELYLPEIFESSAVQGSVGQDFHRVLGWTQTLMFAMPKWDEYRIPEVVPVNREKGATKNENELIQDQNKEYQEDIKRHLPSRTFSLVPLGD
jgi:hypothetical protein